MFNSLVSKSTLLVNYGEPTTQFGRSLPLLRGARLDACLSAAAAAAAAATAAPATPTPALCGTTARLAERPKLSDPPGRTRQPAGHPRLPVIERESRRRGGEEGGE